MKLEYEVGLIGRVDELIVSPGLEFSVDRVEAGGGIDGEVSVVARIGEKDGMCGGDLGWRGSRLGRNLSGSRWVGKMKSV